jgi:Ca2+-binding RTX toxin-like protein
VTLSGSNSSIFGGTGLLNIVTSGTGDDTIGLDTGTAQISAGGSTSLAVFGNSGLLTFVGGAGDSTVFAGTGGGTLFGGAGGALVYGGEVASTSASLFYQAGGGNETLDASPSGTNDSMSGGPVVGSHVSIVGGTGNDTFNAGAGADSLTAGSGANVFVFNKAVINGNTPTDIITGWQNLDNVVLRGYGALNTATIGASSSGGNTTITLSDNTKIEFMGVASASKLTGHFTSS